MEKLDLINVIIKSPFNVIRDALPSLLYQYGLNKDACNDIIGRGYYGLVIKPLNKYYKLRINDKKIKIPVVVKTTNLHDDFYIIEHSNKLFIFNKTNLNSEILIYLYTNSLWLNKKTPNLTYMLTYSICNNNIDSILMERHGLSNRFKIPDLYNPEIILYKDAYIFNNYIETLHKLINYILIKNNTKIELPNKIMCDVIELLDSICISIIHTFNLLYHHNLYLFDMHLDNIFIHWLNKHSHMGDKYIGDIKYINYKIDKRILKINTFGIMLKFADFGNSILKLTDDKYIIGKFTKDLSDYHIGTFETELKINYELFYTLTSIKNMLPSYLYNKLVISKIFESEPLNKYNFTVGIDYNIINKLPSVIDLIEYFDKYFIKKPEAENNKTLVVEEY